jgi:hypothetical protein
MNKFGKYGEGHIKGEKRRPGLDAIGIARIMEGREHARQFMEWISTANETERQAGYPKRNTDDAKGGTA